MTRRTSSQVAVLILGLAACQTRSQAKITTIATGSIGLVGGYFEYRSNHDLPRVTLITGGTIAILSALSIFFLDDQPRTLFDSPRLPWQPDRRHGTSELLAAIRRTGCLGRCPAYSVAIYRDGFVEYYGISDVRTSGRVVGQLSPAQVRALDDQFAQSTFVAFSGSYLEQDCTDLPTTYTWYRPIGRGTKSVIHYHGDRSAPQVLFALEQALDTAVSIEQWIGPVEEHRGPHATFCR